MNEITLRKEMKVENMIYEIRRKQGKLNSEIFTTKCHNHIHYKIITHYDIGGSMLFKYIFTKIVKEKIYDRNNK